MYWLHLEVTISTTLAMLDRFLRDIWLECCGHLSAFTIGGVHYCEDKELFNYGGWGPRKQPLQVALGHVLSPGQTCSYEYDFGSTTELTLKVIAAHEEAIQGSAIRILARNTLPPISCDECGHPATRARRQCFSKDDDDDDGGYLCKACAETHTGKHELLVPLRRVNSPREGVCGYTGPANPAYL